jgi:acyl-coenzyme A synthetase/AMP-(fatty) acid ligase
MKCGLSAAQRAQLDALVAGPESPSGEFICSGKTVADVYSMAAELRATLGPAEEKDVCLAAESKAVMAAALLASLAGGPGMLLPYSFSRRALARMQQDTGFTAAIVDTQREFSGNRSVKIFWPQPKADIRFPAPYRAKPESELLRIFTGGSTGSPQVWSKTGENIFAEALFLARHFNITRQDCIVATVPPYHIYGLLFSVVLPLVSGARVVNATPSFPGDISLAVQEHGATILAAVPAHYRVLRDKPLPGSSLRLAISSAGMLEEEEGLAFFQNNGVGVVEVYGSTETGGIATRNRSLGEAYFTPFSTVRWKIMAERLAVSSPYISPDLPLMEDGYFLAGDRVEADGEGFVLKGRADGVTKVGGKRVDLEEVRQLIKKEPGVTDCLVLALPDTGGRGHRIGALVQGSGIDLRQLKKTLADTLEPYAVPRVFKRIEQVPMKENGKYDREAAIRLLSA